MNDLEKYKKSTQLDATFGSKCPHCGNCLGNSPVAHKPLLKKCGHCEAVFFVYGDGLQETFDFVVSKLFKQGRQSLSEDGWCVYRGPNGLRCAVGHLITDDEYSEKFEKLNVSEYDVRDLLEGNGYNVDFLSQLQSIHDGYHQVYRWYPPFRKLCDTYKLKWRFDI